ncbi:MAG: hypothetical protein NZM43_06150 [Saprospiraceae bacterium]|nr:hypothetical protein [Saprospiraceae bacterium]MDW8483892.1 hypothetical protein [Saprospiraceae bacterium]
MNAQLSLAEAYAWRFPAPDTIRKASDLVSLFRREIELVLDAGHLAPIRLAFGDIIEDHYFLYQEPGRILTTLAWAWPYLTPDQQARTLAYAEAELENPAYAPWAPHFTMPRYVGARREWYLSTDRWGEDATFGDFRPRLHTLYGFWLFCYRSGRTDWMKRYYESARDFYLSQHERARLYGDMCGHIAMARLAEVNGDTTTRNFALLRLETELLDGLNVENKHAFARNGLYGWDAPYNRLPTNDMYNPRKDGWIYRGFIFLNMGPEIARFLRDSCFAQVRAMHEEGKRILPLWWLMQATYYPRWTGDESVGVPSEAFGMYHPVETWILQAPADQLRRYMRSSPTGRGDCYWIEALVQTIEAHSANTRWIDVRTQVFPPIVLEGTVSNYAPSYTPTLRLRLQPNPATHQVRLEISEPPAVPLRWQACDQQGRIVTSGVVAPGQDGVLVSLNHWPSGSYLISLLDERHQSIHTQTLIIP